MMRFLLIEKIDSQKKELIQKNQYYIAVLVFIFLMCKYPNEIDQYTVEWQDITYILNIAMSVENDVQDKSMHKM